MAANSSPIFTLNPIISSGSVSVANTNRDGTGTLVVFATGGTNGTRISRITVQAIVTTTAGMIRIFIDSGSSIRLWKEIAVTAITGSASLPEFVSTIYMPGEMAIVLPYNYTLKAATHNAESFVVIAEGGDY